MSSEAIVIAAAALWFCYGKGNFSLFPIVAKSARLLWAVRASISWHSPTEHALTETSTIERVPSGGMSICPPLFSLHSNLSLHLKFNTLYPNKSLKTHKCHWKRRLVLWLQLKFCYLCSQGWWKRLIKSHCNDSIFSFNRRNFSRDATRCHKCVTNKCNATLAPVAMPLHCNALWHTVFVSMLPREM